MADDKKAAPATAAKAAVDPAAPEAVMYVMVMPFWDGRKLHPKGSKLQFIEGTQPHMARRAKPVKKEPLADDEE